jgi:hypothetical protein
MPLRLRLDADDSVQPSFFTEDNVAKFQEGLGLDGAVTAASSGEVTAHTVSTKFVSPLTLAKAQANGVASLDGGGKVPHAQLPFEAYGQRFSASSQVAMLALTAQPGDSCLRSDDGNHTWLLVDADPAQLSSWIRQTTTADAPVQSVNSLTGAVTITAAGLGAAAASDLSAHAANISNPHGVTKAQVGLGSVTNDAQVKRSEMGSTGGVATLGSDGKVPAGQLPPTSGGTVPGATSSTPGVIQLAGDLAGTASAPTVPALSVKVNTSDARLSDNRTPTDASVTNAKVASNAAIAESKLDLASDAAAGVASRRTLGTGATQAAAGNDSRLSNARTPTTHNSTHATGGTDALTPGDIGAATASALAIETSARTSGDSTNATAISTHAALTNNPHSVTKTQVGLSNVPNTDATVRANHTGEQTISTITSLQAALDLKASLASPALTGTPTAPTAAVGANSTQLATTAHVKASLEALVAGAPGALDTLNEIAEQLADDENAVAALTSAVTGKAAKSANLSDLTNAATARANLELGSAATLDVGATGGTVAAGNDARITGAPYLKTVSARGIAKELWIALRTDGAAGSGTAEDPLDGSTQPKFDALMQSLASGSVVHLGAGTYLTKGGTVGTSHGYEWTLPDVVTIIGSGIDKTIVKLANNSIVAGQSATVFRHAAACTSAEFYDFTIDCNIANQAGAGVGILINGLNTNCLRSVVERIKAINFGGDAGEGFPLVLACYSTVADSHHLIVACELDYPSATTTGISGIGIYGQRATGLVSGCHVNGRNVAEMIGYSCAAGGKGIRFIGNISLDCGYGFHADTATDAWPFEGMQLLGNSFLACARDGLDIGEPTTGAGYVGRFKHFCVESNYITLKSESASGGNNPNGIWLRGDVRDSLFLNNVVTVAAGYTWDGIHGGVALLAEGTNSGNTFKGNRLHNSLVGYIPTANGWGEDNLRFDGTSIFIYGVATAPAPLPYRGDFQTNDAAKAAVTIRDSAGNVGLKIFNGGYAGDGGSANIRAGGGVIYLNAATIIQLQNDTLAPVQFAGPVMVGSTSVLSGSGSPEGAVTAAVGSLYLRTNGGAGTTMYVKESGAGNTGWVGK